MTNSASEPGSDDILASIRRLVSAAPARPGPQGDRLLLTPALRVPEADEDDAPAVAGPRGLTLEDRIAELEAAVGSQSVEFEPDGSEVAHIAPPDDLVRAVENLEFGTADEDENEDDEARAQEPSVSVPSPGDGHEPSARPDEAAQTPAETAVEPAVEAPSERRGLFLAVPSNDNRAEGPDRPAEAAGGGADGLPAGLFFTRHDRPHADVPTEHPAAITPEDLAGTETPAEAEPAPAPAPAEDMSGLTAGAVPHEDAAAQDEHVHAAQPDTDAPVLPTFRHKAQPEEAPSAPSAEAGPMPGIEIDEDRLRAIVAELLRDELQGPLGEKITRNIRKLVRREIERALAVRDFD